MFLENIKIAIRSIRSNLLRSLLTIMIIMVGITALVGILTAIDTMLYSINDNFSSIGANSFKITPAYASLKSNRHGRRKRVGEVINFRQADQFKEKYFFPGAKTSVFTRYLFDATVKYKDKKTNPNKVVIGIDENYMDIAGLEIGTGRFFSNSELLDGMHKVILGNGIAKKIFKVKKDKILGKIVDINGYKYKVIGILKEKGSNKNSNSDQSILIPLLNGKRYYHYKKKDYGINIGLDNSLHMDEAISKATGIFRNIRKLKIKDENDFEIKKSDNILKMIKDATFQIRFATIAIALITLLGAAIGLMNIMLVMVSERTREIGIRKSIGATNRHILTQFMTESVIISQIGGLLGIIFGVIIGIVLAHAIDGQFRMPWAWIGLAIIINTFVGLLSGVYPAMKAAKLDPIESLRYE